MTSAPPARRGETSPLLPAVLDAIRECGPLRFDEFMRMALTHPDGGYYTAGPQRPGAGGDFVTSPEVSAGFGECLGRQIAELVERLGDGPVTLVELGAGTGRLAADVLTALPARDGQPLTLLLVEASAQRREEQSERIAVLERTHAGLRVLQAASLDEARRLVPAPIAGVVWSNEYYDALPVRLVARRGGRLHESFVARGAEGRLEMIERPAEDPELLDYAARYGVASDEGFAAEIGLEAMRAAAGVGAWLGRGWQILVDYGHPAAELYSERHARGTLLAYSGHRTNEDFLERIGSQDLTAHVNFTAVENAAGAEGLRTLGRTTQDRFLVSLGLADRIVELAGSSDPQRIRRRLALMMLLHPEGMGRTFQVLIQAKGIGPGELPSGLRDPWARRAEPAHSTARAVAP